MRRPAAVTGAWVVVMALACFSVPLHAAKYVMYPLYFDTDCSTPACNEDFSCAHTCAMHGLTCEVEDFDCHAEAVKYCEGKELTMLIEGQCKQNVCDVDCERGIYYSSLEHTGRAVCDSGPDSFFCPRPFPDSLCQCELPAASQDLYDQNVAVKITGFNFKLFGFLAFGTITFGVIVMRIYRKCVHKDDSDSFTESELAFLALESNNNDNKNSNNDDMSASSSDVLLKKSSKQKKEKEKTAKKLIATATDSHSHSQVKNGSSISSSKKQRNINIGNNSRSVSAHTYTKRGGGGSNYL